MKKTQDYTQHFVKVNKIIGELHGLSFAVVLSTIEYIYNENEDSELIDGTKSVMMSEGFIERHATGVKRTALKKAIKKMEALGFIIKFTAGRGNAIHIHYNKALVEAYKKLSVSVLTDKFDKSLRLDKEDKARLQAEFDTNLASGKVTLNRFNKGIKELKKVKKDYPNATKRKAQNDLPPSRKTTKSKAQNDRSKEREKKALNKTTKKAGLSPSALVVAVKFKDLYNTPEDIESVRYDDEPKKHHKGGTGMYSWKSTKDNPTSLDTNVAAIRGHMIDNAPGFVFHNIYIEQIVNLPKKLIREIETAVSENSSKSVGIISGMLKKMTEAYILRSNERALKSLERYSNKEDSPLSDVGDEIGDIYIDDLGDINELDNI